MAIKIAINGYGRIGRNVLRALYEANRTSEIEIVAINDLGSAETNAHLTKYDTAHGMFPGDVSVDGDYMVVNGDKIKVCAERNPADLPWGELGVDVVLECTGFSHHVIKLQHIYKLEQRKLLSRLLLAMQMQQLFMVLTMVF